MGLHQEGIGDVDLLQDWYRQYYTPLTKFLQSRFGSGPPDPEDIAQSTFTRLLDHPNLRMVSNPRAFLCQIGRNLAISELRSRTTAERNCHELAASSSLPEGYLLVPERVLDAREQIQAIAKALKKMPVRRRAVLLMVRVDGLTQSKVARRLNISPPAVSRHLGMATAELYDALM
ncbi:MAG: sigma-70 family RNA polymerase sigma factor [Pseudomonadota bacterium]